MEKPLDKQISNALIEIYKSSNNGDGIIFQDLKDKLNYDNLEKLRKLIFGLQEFGFVRINKRNQIKLTNRGKKLTIEVIRNNTLPQSLMSNFLGISLGENLIKDKGDRFYNKEGCDKDKPCRLIDVDPPKVVEIIKITSSSQIERQLISIGIIPGIKARIKTKAILGGTLILKIKGFEVALSKHVAKNILVKEID